MIQLFEDPTSVDPMVSTENLNDEQVLDHIRELKEELKEQVVILGHHYQQDDIIQFADFTGDSLKLAKDAQSLSRPYILFCGVHFMAETADMLSTSEQKVILPDLNAGCSMADMANRVEVDRCWDYLTSCTSDKIIPITYINCSADLKAFVGLHEGAICTSSNAKKIITWGLNQGQKLLFFPDQHLGRNTCFELGIKLDEMVIFDPRRKNGGLNPEQVKKAKVILWYGYCSVHQGFKKEHIDHVRSTDPNAVVIVHPECSFDVVSASDLNGSTAYIIDVITKAKPGSCFAVGTEINLVSRLASVMPDKTIYSLSPYQCLCATMYRVRPRWLLTSLEAIKNGNPINVIKVDPEVTYWSLKALDRMLALS